VENRQAIMRERVRLPPIRLSGWTSEGSVEQAHSVWPVWTNKTAIQYKKVIVGHIQAFDPVCFSRCCISRHEIRSLPGTKAAG